MVKVAFVDDGINQEFIPPGVPFENYNADETGVFLYEPIDGVSHGTMCFQIFNNNVRTPYHLISIKVLDNLTGSGNHKALITALDWCAAQDFDIINMSMGTRQYIDFAAIAAAVGRINKTIIVAACSNENELTFPACLPSVIGVRHSNRKELIGNFAYLHKPYDQINIITCVNDEPISFGDNYIEKMSGANSFATPLVTARICNYIAEGCSTLDNVKKCLQSKSVKDTYFASHAFYKNLMRSWEDCTIPIVAMPDTTLDANHKLDALLKVFIQDGYRAIALSATKKTNTADFIYSLNWHGSDMITQPDLIELYYNFTLPDILFLQMPMKDMFALPEKLQADIVLKLPGKQKEYDIPHETHTLDLKLSAEQLFAEIVKVLT